MCPACLTALALTTVAATTGVGAGAAVTAFVVRSLGGRTKDQPTAVSTRKDLHEHLETNRDA